MFNGELAKAYQWPQTMFDGSTRTFECYVRSDTAAVIPFLDKDTVLLTKQEQPHRELFWDVPGGRVDPGETIEQAAFRELLEETGYQAQTRLQWLSREHHGMVRFTQEVYLAKDLIFDPNHPTEHAGEKIELVPTSWHDLIQICLEKRLRQPDIMLAILCMEYNLTDRARLDAFLNS